MYQIGEGNDAYTDDSIRARFGHFNLDLALTKSGDDRANFLQRNPTDVLYWWHILDVLDLITMVCVKLNIELRAESHTPPRRLSDLANVYQKQKRQAMKQDESAKNLDSLMSQVGKMADEMINMNSKLSEDTANLAKKAQERDEVSIIKEIAAMEEKVGNLRVALILEENQAIKAVYEARISKLNDDIAELSNKKQRIN